MISPNKAQSIMGQLPNSHLAYKMTFMHKH